MNTSSLSENARRKIYVDTWVHQGIQHAVEAGGLFERKFHFFAPSPSILAYRHAASFFFSPSAHPPHTHTPPPLPVDLCCAILLVNVSKHLATSQAIAPTAASRHLGCLVFKSAPGGEDGVDLVVLSDLHCEGCSCL